MNKYTKRLILFFILIIIAKAVLSSFIPAPSSFGDSYTYSKMARSFFYYGNFEVHGMAIKEYTPLYSIMLSPSYLFKDMNLVYWVMKFINAILSSLIIFPVWLLTKEFITKKRAFLTSVLVSLIPSNFSFAPYLMAENLFYPLFLFFIYFIYKSVIDNRYRWSVLSGLFIGLVCLTKRSGFILFILPILIFIISYLLKKENLLNLKKIIILYFIAILILIPWLIRNALYFGLSINGLLGKGFASDATAFIRHSFYFPSFINWIILYFGYLLLGSLVIFGVISLILFKKDKKNKNLFALLMIFSVTIILSLLVAANHAAGGLSPYKSPFVLFTERPIGRYIDVVLPLLFILGSIGFKKYEDNKKVLAKSLNKLLIMAILILGFSAQLTIANLFPVNNISLAYIGSIKYVLGFLFNKTEFYWPIFFIMLIIFILIPFTFLILNKSNKLKFKRIFIYITTFFILVSLLNYGITYYNSKTYWYEGDQMQLALWFNSYDKTISTILFDQRDCIGPIEKLNQTTLCEMDKQITIMGFWMNDNIKVGDISNLEDVDYVISKHKLKLNMVKNKGEFYIYKTKII